MKLKLLVAFVLAVAAMAFAQGGTVTHTTGALPAGNFVCGNGTADIKDCQMPYFLDPSKYVFYYDEFLTNGVNNGVNVAGAMNWIVGYTGSNAAQAIVNTAGSYGAEQCTAGNSSGSRCQFYQTWNTAGFLNYAATTFDVRCRARVVQTTSIAALLCGLINTPGSETSVEYWTDFMVIDYDTTQSDTHYTFARRSASGTVTRVASSVAVDTSFHDFRICSATAGTVYFSVDSGTGTCGLAGTAASTVIPTVALQPEFLVISQTSATRAIEVDSIWHWAAVTR